MIVFHVATVGLFLPFGLFLNERYNSNGNHILDLFFKNKQ